MSDLPETGAAAAEAAERGWTLAVGGALALMLAVTTGTALVAGRHPPSNVEAVDPATLHLRGEFTEGNLGTAVGADGVAVARVLTARYQFTPHCMLLPARTPVVLRMTSPDVLHGIVVTGTNVNAEVVPGFVSEVRTRFDEAGEHTMPCHEFCGLGHHGMWGVVRVVEPKDWPGAPGQVVSCDAAAQ